MDVKDVVVGCLNRARWFRGEAKARRKGPDFRTASWLAKEYDKLAYDLAKAQSDLDSAMLFVEDYEKM